ncbi:hypothetical protein [Breoghania sp.]|uniref:hypothetical protein n=1 Tax=Breoghania sp. TaxID=2065378 RepID=UPI002606CA47|nr:hypothetical protein [Breoghania sp.]MDJ0930652.1 hypothetical protein [Breoghania sp.]
MAGAGGDDRTAAVPSIKEFRLAQSQLEKFTADVLKKGDPSEVESATLLPNGLIEVVLRGRAPPRSIRGGVETVSVEPHDLSDEWVRVSVPDGNKKEPVALNTIDSFTSKEEVENWREDAEKQIKLLAKLTERDVPAQDAIVVADAGKEALPGQKAEPQASPALQKAERKSAALQDAPKVIPAATSTEEPATDFGSTPELAEFTPSEDQCGESLYVSFKFPEDYSKINHFNIFTPDSAIMTDNGDGTGYLTGACVQGRYRYKCVVVNHDEKRKAWSSSLQEGSFVIASLLGQCEIDLNDPAKSATLNCF